MLNRPDHLQRPALLRRRLIAKALEREPDATAERRVELRTEAGKAARHNVAFFDVTFSVQKSVTLLHTAFEAQEVAARAAGDEETASAWGRFREAVESAIWKGNNAGLAYLAEHAPAGLRWALAGRNRDKLEAVRARLAGIDPRLTALPLLEADSSDTASLRQLAASTRVVSAQITSFQSRASTVSSTTTTILVYMNCRRKLQIPNITRLAWPGYCFFMLATERRYEQPSGGR